MRRPKSIEVDETRVACDGGGGALGHPRVYLEMGDEQFRRMPLLRPALRAARRSRSGIDERPSSPLKKGDHLYLIDGSGYLFRAYHALPPLSRKSDGLPTGAVSGFCNMLWKLLEDTKQGDAPTPSGGDLRRRQEDVPQRHLSPNTRPTGPIRRKT